MKILFISQYYPPEMGALASRASELCKAWSDAGNDVSVLTAFPNYPSGIIPKEYRGLKWKTERVNGVNIVRTYIYAGHYKGKLNRVLNYMSFLFSGIFWGRKHVEKPDVIIASSPPILVPFIGYFLSKIKNSPLVFEVRDLWPESIIQISDVDNRLIIGILKKLEMFLYQKAQMIIVVTESFKSFITKLGIESDKIKIVKNGVDLELYDPNKIDVFPESIAHLKKKFIVSYIGNHGMAQGLNTIIQVAIKYAEKSNIHFLFVGDGAEKPQLEQKSRELNLSNVTFTGQIDKQEMPGYYAASSVILVPLRNLPLFQTVIPSKIFEIMAMEKPIVLSVPGEVKNIVVNDAKAGLYAEPENIDDICDAILELFNSSEKRAEMGRNGRKFVEKYYSRIKLAEKYLEYLKKMER